MYATLTTAYGMRIKKRDPSPPFPHLSLYKSRSRVEPWPLIIGLAYLILYRPLALLSRETLKYSYPRPTRDL